MGRRGLSGANGFKRAAVIPWGSEPCLGMWLGTEAHTLLPRAPGLSLSTGKEEEEVSPDEELANGKVAATTILTSTWEVMGI